MTLPDPRHAFDEHGNILPVQEWPDDVAVSSLKVREERDEHGGAVVTIKEIRFWDKGRQLELSCRHLGLLVDRVNVRVDGTVGERMARIRERLAREATGMPAE